MFFFRRVAPWRPVDRAPDSDRLSALPTIKQLESLLTPHAASGNAWSHPRLITVSEKKQ
jgi:hypothetical protein